MSPDENVVADARCRLRRIQGQVTGILATIEEGRSCRDVIQQIAAASRALDRAGLELLVSQLQYCLEDEEAAKAEGYDPAEVERLFLMLG
ncbi:MAG: metal-sensitive transcriptional regulator [Acidimicrobiales bacterium]